MTESQKKILAVTYSHIPQLAIAQDAIGSLSEQELGELLGPRIKSIIRAIGVESVVDNAFDTDPNVATASIISKQGGLEKMFPKDANTAAEYAKKLLCAVNNGQNTGEIYAFAIGAVELLAGSQTTIS